MNDRLRRGHIDGSEDPLDPGDSGSDAVDDTELVNEAFWGGDDRDLTEPLALDADDYDITRTDHAVPADGDTDAWVDPAQTLGEPGLADTPMAFPTPAAVGTPPTTAAMPATDAAPAWVTPSPTPAPAPVSPFPPPVVNHDAAVFHPGQPLIDPSTIAAAPTATPVGGPALTPGLPTAIPARPPLRGHRDLVPTADGVPLGGWDVQAPVEESTANPGRAWAGYLLILSATLVALATFFPWAEVATRGGIRQLTGWRNISGGVSDGPIHLVAGIVGVVCGGLALGGRHGIWVRVVGAVTGLVSLTAAALRAASYATTLDQLDGVDINAIAIMWGLWLIVAGAFIMTGAAMLLRR